MGNLGKERRRGRGVRCVLPRGDRLATQRMAWQLKAATLLACTFALSAVPSAPASAHPGGLNSEGCHTNRNTGDYHCHRGGGGSAPAPRQRPQAALGSFGGTFRNCTEARAAGAAPVLRGTPGYGPHLDRDGDGVGCEPYRGR